MRSVLVLPVALSFVFGTAAAQDTPPTPSRWTFSVGPEWGLVAPHTNLWGMRLRAEYDLTRPNSVFGLRLEGGARWSPTQGYFYSDNVATWSGIEQRSDLMLGLSGSLSPLPRARIAPYATMGVFARQLWIHGSSHLSFQPGPFPSNSAVATRSSGDIIASLGVGLRGQVAGHSFQLEIRRLYRENGLTFGTRLPF
jgi:hypothetical protein